MTHVMLDLETLSLDNNAVVVSISAVEFDLETGTVGSNFEVALDILQQALNGGDIDKKTLTWWSSQDDKAKQALTRLRSSMVDGALNKFNNWLNELEGQNKDIKLWGNGCTADNVWVRNLYSRHNIEFVLPYWCDSDVRTLVTLGKINTRDFTFKGIKHNGLDDCLHQIEYCVAAYKKLNGDSNV